MHTRPWFLSLALVLANPAVAGTPASDAPFSAEAALADIDLAEEAYSRLHAGYDRYTPADELHEAWDALRADVSDGTTVGELYLGVQAVLAQIHCDHTKVELPKALRDERRERPLYLPARWTYHDGVGVITTSGADGIQPGDRILAIDEQPLRELAAKVRPLIPVDGDTTWSADVGIGESLEFMGGAVDHFGALMWEVGPTAALTLERGDDTMERTVNRVTFDAWTDLGPDSVANFKDAVSWERIGDDAALLRIDTFVNYREPVKPKDLYDPIFDALRAEGRSTLIVDLRNNGGGSGDAQLGLLSRLIDAPVRPATAVCARSIDTDGLRERLWSWNKRILNPNPLGFVRKPEGEHCLRRFLTRELRPVRPKRNAFTGDLILLTSHANSSASTTLMALLKTHRKATLVGAPTGGSADGPTAGVLYSLTLPNSFIRGRIPFLRFHNNAEVDNNRLGVAPDIEVLNMPGGPDDALQTAIDLAKPRSVIQR